MAVQTRNSSTRPQAPKVSVRHENLPTDRPGDIVVDDLGRVPKWTKGTDCKSVIRRFESDLGLWRCGAPVTAYNPPRQVDKARWRNWQTHYFEVVAPRGVQVQILSWA